MRKLPEKARHLVKSCAINARADPVSGRIEKSYFLSIPASGLFLDDLIGKHGHSARFKFPGKTVCMPFHVSYAQFCKQRGNGLAQYEVGSIILVGRRFVNKNKPISHIGV